MKRVDGASRATVCAVGASRVIAVDEQEATRIVWDALWLMCRGRWQERGGVDDCGGRG